MEKFELRRYPHHKNELLRAWDAADELVRAHLASVDSTGKRALVIHDGFGGLSVPLSRTHPDLDLTVYTDSYSSSRAIELNSQGRLKPIHDPAKFEGMYDLVLVRIPKNLAYFEDLLARLSGHLHPGAQFIAATMVKYQTDRAFDLIAQYVGATTTSLAQKKARLIFAAFERGPALSPYPTETEIEGFEIPFLHHSNLFSRERLDIGTRFFLEHVPDGVTGTVLDLGCGNGILGIATKKKNPAVKIVCADDSWMALESARASYSRYFKEPAEFIWTNCFEDGVEASVDHVVCNPPFHQGTSVGDFTAWQMFTDARRVLKPGGRIRVVGNGHLQYPNVLKKIFGNSEVIAQNAKFVVADAEASDG